MVLNSVFYMHFKSYYLRIFLRIFEFILYYLNILVVQNSLGNCNLIFWRSSTQIEMNTTHLHAMMSL